MAWACRQLGYDRVAIYGYQKALAEDPNNKKYNQLLTEIYERRGEYADSVKCWQRIQKSNPLDSEAATKLSDLRAAIRNNPTGQENYVKLAEHYKREGEWEAAIQTFEQALAVSDGDPAIRERLEAVELEQMRQYVTRVEDVLSKNPGDESARNVSQRLAGEILEREINLCTSPLEREPVNMQLRYDLGRKLMSAGKCRQAIPVFQPAVDDVRLKGDVLVALGKCYMIQKKRKRARSQLKKAIPEISRPEKSATLKEVHYLLARLCEADGEVDAAENHYSEVLAVDYQYKDARRRLERLQAGGEG